MLKILERKIRRAEATQPARRQAGERERDGYLHRLYERKKQTGEVGLRMDCVHERERDDEGELGIVCARVREAGGYGCETVRVVREAGDTEKR